jgi:hypothetical protein
MRWVVYIGGCHLKGGKAKKGKAEKCRRKRKKDER